MRLKSKQNVLTEAVSELKDVDYTKVPGLDSIYHRLSKGREEFAGVFEKNIKAVMQISSLDLAMQHQTEKIDDIYHKISKATETIFGSPAGSSYSAGHTNNRHEELTNTIIEISSKTEKIHKKIGTGQEELTVIKNLSEQTIEDSKEMQKDMDQLVGIINTMTGIIAGIDTISLQTNLLALNASIEAAKAGQAGKGFAVVADEINSLSAESSNATSKIDAILKDIIETVESTHKVMEQNNEVVNISSGRLEDTVKIFKSMLKSSEEVINITRVLKTELEDIVVIKEQLLGVMKCVDDSSKNFMDSTEGISASTEEQVAGLANIVKTMKDMQSGMEKLDGVLHNRKENKEQQSA